MLRTFKFIVLISVFTLLLFSCKNATDMVKAERGESIPQDIIAAITDSEQEQKVLLDLIKIFDELICGVSVDRPIHECYAFHQQTIKMELLNQSALNSSFPFNGKFDLSMVENAEMLSFLSDKCGFMVQDSDEKVNYLCLKANSKFITYVSKETKNSLITDFITKFQKDKVILGEDLQGIRLDNEIFDFKNPEERLFYMLIYINLNEEFLANVKIAKMNKAVQESKALKESTEDKEKES